MGIPILQGTSATGTRPKRKMDLRCLEPTRLLGRVGSRGSRASRRPRVRAGARRIRASGRRFSSPTPTTRPSRPALFSSPKGGPSIVEGTTAWNRRAGVYGLVRRFRDIGRGRRPALGPVSAGRQGVVSRLDAAVTCSRRRRSLRGLPLGTAARPRSPFSGGRGRRPALGPVSAGGQPWLVSLPAEGRAFVVIVRDSRQLNSQRPRPASWMGGRPQGSYHYSVTPPSPTCAAFCLSTSARFSAPVCNTALAIEAVRLQTIVDARRLVHRRAQAGDAHMAVTLGLRLVNVEANAEDARQRMRGPHQAPRRGGALLRLRRATGPRPRRTVRAVRRPAGGEPAGVARSQPGREQREAAGGGRGEAAKLTHAHR